MGKFIHTIQINNERGSGSTVSATRETESRRYEACIVVTTTEKSVEIALAARAKNEAALEAYKVSLAERCAKFGMTVDEAKAWHKEVTDRWYKEEDGWHATCRKFRAAYEAKTNSRFTMVRFDDEVRRDMVKRGFEDPYDQDGKYGICMADAGVSGLTARLARPDYALGSQAVVSWHGNVGLAQKALAGTDRYREMGDSVEIRTDIEIKERVKRSKKTA